MDESELHMTADEVKSVLTLTDADLLLFARRGWLCPLNYEAPFAAWQYCVSEVWGKVPEELRGKALRWIRSTVAEKQLGLKRRWLAAQARKGIIHRIELPMVENTEHAYVFEELVQIMLVPPTVNHMSRLDVLASRIAVWQRECRLQKQPPVKGRPDGYFFADDIRRCLIEDLHRQ